MVTIKGYGAAAADVDYMQELLELRVITDHH